MITQIKILRLKRDLTQQELAELMGISESKMTKLETYRQKMTDKELSKLAKILKVKVSEIQQSKEG